MPNFRTARFQIALSPNAIDADAGIIRGVKVMELGRAAVFADDKGKRRNVLISSKHVDALLRHAGNRAIPMHLTHDWFAAQGKSNADTVEMQARIGALKSFRKDDAGNLVADIVLKDGPSKSDILFGAEHNPEDNMLSAVFNFREDDADCIPQNFRAADLVPQGAATTALFSDDSNENNDMDILELLKQAASDPTKRAALKALIKEIESGEADDAAADDTAAAGMESDAGVTDADKKKDDDTKPALMRAQLRIARVINRKSTELNTSRTAILAEAKIQAEAAVAGKVGSKAFLSQVRDSVDELPFVALLSHHETTCKDRGKAILRAKADNPAAYNDWEKAGRPMPAKAA